MNAKPRALLIEDDPELYSVLEALADQLGYALEHRASGRTGLEAALSEDYAFIICDLNLPNLDGLEVCKRVRAEKKQVPFLMLTSRDDELSKVLLLESGADDYITKPFSGAELKARIKTVLRRSEDIRGQETEFEHVTVGELRLDRSRRLAWVGEREIRLTFIEFEILSTLASRPGHAFSRAQILEAIDGYSGDDYQRGVTVHMTRIRGKLGAKAAAKYLITVRGVGYRLPAPSELDDDAGDDA